MLKIGKSEPSLNKFFSVCIAGLEAKESMVLEVRDNHFSLSRVMCQIEGFMVQNHGTPDLNYEKVPDTVSGACLCRPCRYRLWSTWYTGSFER